MAGEARETIAVVVPNFDGAALLPLCLESLARQSRPADEVVVVDDASRDGSAALVERDFPWARVVRRAVNGGFTAAVNDGVRACRSAAVALLNNDAVAEPGWLAALEDALVRNPAAMAFACRMLTQDEPPRIDSAGLALTHGFGQLSLGDGAPDGPAFDGEREVLGACGGAALYRRTLFERVGGLDESLYMQWEDYDLALRALRAGLPALYVGAARVRHARSATLGRHSARSVYLYFRNRRRVIRRNVPWGLRVREAPRAAGVVLRGLALSLRRGRFLAALRGHLAGAWATSPVAPPPAVPGFEARFRRFLDEGSGSRRARRASGLRGRT